MKFWHAGAACAALFVGVAASNIDAQAQSRPPVEAFGQLPALSHPRLSPDGKHFAVVQNAGGRPVAVIYTVNAPPGTKPNFVASSEWIIEDVKWAKKDRLLILLGQDLRAGWDEKELLRGWGRALSVSESGDNQVLLLERNRWMQLNTNAAVVDDVDVDDPDNIIMPLYGYGGNSTFTLNLYRVNVRTGDAENFQNGGATTAEWFLDGHGHVVARLDGTASRREEHLSVYENGDWHEDGVFPVTADRGAGVVGLLEDGKALARFNSDANSMETLVRHELDTGKESELFANSKFDIAGTLTNDWTGRTVGAYYWSDRPEYFYFDPAGEALQRGLEQAFQGLTVVEVSRDMTGDKVIVRTEGARSPPAYYYLDRTTHQASPIGSEYPQLNGSDLGEMKSYNYVARDGLPIAAYLTLPPGRSSKALPAVVMPHGGPDARDVLHFDWWAQFMANRGYAVLQPNFRGSSGYGHKFTDAGLHQWGRKMQDDISDGVKKMIADGIADPKRICIVGASYGGYAALAGATLTPDLYACAVSVAGISDLPQMLHDERQRYGAKSATVSFWISRIGSNYDDSEELRAVSPARHADQVKCPILLLHGDRDTTVPIEQSELMETALKTAGKNVEFVKLDGDDHYLQLGVTRVRLLSELEHFLDAQIGH